MITFIDAYCIIANAFYVNPDKDEFILAKLHRDVRKLGAELASSDVVLLWTRDDLSYCFYYYSDLFMHIKPEDIILRLPMFDEYSKDSKVFNAVFNHNLDTYVVDQIQEFFIRNGEYL